MENSMMQLPLKTETSNGQNPQATSLFNLIDRKRLEAVRSISNRLRINPDTISQERFGLSVDELSNAGADEVLEILNELHNEASVK